MYLIVDLIISSEVLCSAFIMLPTNSYKCHNEGSWCTKFINYHNAWKLSWFMSSIKSNRLFWSCTRYIRFTSVYNYNSASTPRPMSCIAFVTWLGHAALLLRTMSDVWRSIGGRMIQVKYMSRNYVTQISIYFTNSDKKWAVLYHKSTLK